MEPTARPDTSPGLDVTEVDPEPPPAIAPADLLADAATAIHAERDTGRLVEWVLDRCLDLVGADAGGLWLHADGILTWSRAGSPHVDPSVLGDVRTWPALAA